jgi:hypothetical protein
MVSGEELNGLTSGQGQNGTPPLDFKAYQYIICWKIRGDNNWSKK